MVDMVKGRQYMHGLHVCYASITEMNSTDLLSTSIVDKSDISMFQLQRRTRQYSTLYRSVRSTRTRIACMNVYVLYIALASFIYTWDYVSQKNV